MQIQKDGSYHVLGILINGLLFGSDHHIGYCESIICNY